MVDQFAGFWMGEVACWEPYCGSGRVSDGCGFAFACVWNHLSRFFFEEESQSSAGRSGFRDLRGRGCTSAADKFPRDGCSSVSTRDSNSESRTCIGGRLGIWVGWTPKLGGLRWFGGVGPLMGGRAGNVGSEGCSSAGTLAGAVISSASA